MFKDCKHLLDIILTEKNSPEVIDNLDNIKIEDDDKIKYSHLKLEYWNYEIYDKILKEMQKIKDDN